MSVHGKLNAHHCAEFEREIQKLIDVKLRVLVLELRYLSQLSNMGVATMVSCFREIQEKDGLVCLIEPSAKARESFELHGLWESLHVLSSSEEARSMYGVERKR